MKAKKAEKCSDMKPAVGEAGYKLNDFLDINVTYTDHVTAEVGTNNMS